MRKYAQPIRMAEGTPLCDLQLPLLHNLGVEVDHFGDSTAALADV